MTIQKHIAEIPYLPLIFSQNYAHRLYKGYQYTDDMRETVHETGCAWVIDRIFAVQTEDSRDFEHKIQHWDIKTMFDGSVMLSCSNEKGKVVYYEHGFMDQTPDQDLSFVLFRNILHVKNKKDYS